MRWEECWWPATIKEKKVSARGGEVNLLVVFEVPRALGLSAEADTA